MNVGLNDIDPVYVRAIRHKGRTEGRKEVLAELRKLVDHAHGAGVDDTGLSLVERWLEKCEKPTVIEEWEEAIKAELRLLDKHIHTEAEASSA
jgi:hypothetical protein